uniref:Uncharacterized protein n=1 Tax=Heterosigma akashiwo TaxID=2829 RepID=A0A7S3XN92_HETAK
MELAVMQNDFVMTKIVLEKQFFDEKVLVATSLKDRHTPLMWSILHGNAAIAELLLHNGAAIPDYALHTSLEHNSPPELIDILLSTKPSIIHRANKENLTPLCVAISKGNAAAVAIILAHMSDPSEPVQNFNVTSTLAEKGAEGGATPCALCVAIGLRSVELVQLLLRANGEKPWPPGLHSHLRTKMPMFALQTSVQGFLQHAQQCGQGTAGFYGSTMVDSSEPGSDADVYEVIGPQELQEAAPGSSEAEIAALLLAAASEEDCTGYL